MSKNLKVIAIEKGTVIDHIPCESIFKIVDALDLTNMTEEILIGTNFKSKKRISKGIVKISNRYLTQKEIDKIAILATGAILNKINNFEVLDKQKIDLPSEVKFIVKCFNPNCITNHEKIETSFNVVSKVPVTLQCKYCEKLMNKKEILFF